MNTIAGRSHRALAAERFLRSRSKYRGRMQKKTNPIMFVVVAAGLLALAGFALLPMWTPA